MIMAIAVIFWVLRIAATYCSVMATDFMIKPLDVNVEISLLFIALVSFVLIGRRLWLGAIIYAVSYELYFGAYLINNIMNISSLSMDGYTNIFFSFIGMILPIFVIFDLLLDKNRKAHPKDKKTDWFYNNKDFDRNMDERADKNNYRTL